MPAREAGAASRSEHCRASRRTSGTGNGATRDCPAAPCTRRAAARLLVMAVTPGRRHEGCGSLGGTALRVVERSASCRTSLPRGCLACSPRSNTASLSHRRPRAWRPPPMRSADPRSRLPSAVRWLRRRIQAVKTALAHVRPRTVIGSQGRRRRSISTRDACCSAFAGRSRRRS